MTGSAPIDWGMEGSTVDEKVAPTLDEWEAPVVDGVDVLSNPGGVPNMVETMALIEDIVGLTPTETLESLDYTDWWSHGFGNIKT